jgi:DNA modification methylase
MSRSETHRQESTADTNRALLNADARHLQDVLTEQCPESLPIELTITSPPYADQKDYGYDEELQVGLGDSYAEYLSELRDIFRQLYEVTAEDGMLWIVANTFKRDGRLVRLPFDIADVCENLYGPSSCPECQATVETARATGELQCPGCGWSSDAVADSWTLQDVVVWDKQRARPWSGKGRFRNVHEYVLCFSKGDTFSFDLDAIRVADVAELKEWWVRYPHRYNPRGKVPDNIWEMLTPNQGAFGDGTLDHPAPFPPQLVERITRLTTDPGDVVFDPFAGTGTVLAQAEALDRQPLGLELSPEYVAAYPEVREKVHAEFDTEASVQAKQQRLKDLLCGLREVRYARELVRIARKELDAESLAETGIHTVFQISRGPVRSDPEQDRHYVSSAYDVVLDVEDSDVERDRVAAALDTAAETTPCSTFGIDARTRVCSTAELYERRGAEWGEQPLFHYSDDDQTWFDTTLTLSEWRQAAGNPAQWREAQAARGHPPVISNVGVTVTDPASASAPSDRSEHTYRVKRVYPDAESTVTDISP